MKGPIFVSIGDADKLNAFLDVNPWIERESMFVDDYSFDAYKAAGFKRIDQEDKELVKQIKLGGAPELNFKEWINYFSNVGKISPVPKDAKFGEFPEGVLWTGGTFVVKGNDVVYQWTDVLPGNHPIVEDVFAIAKSASVEKKQVKSEKKLLWF